MRVLSSSRHIFLVVLLVMCGAASRAETGQRKAPAGDSSVTGRWMALPYFKSGSWWLPLDLHKPLKIQAEYMALVGSSCYIVQNAEFDYALLDSRGRPIAHGAFIQPIDATRFLITPTRQAPGYIVSEEGAVLSPANVGLNEPYDLDFRRKMGLPKTAAPVVERVSSLNTGGWGVANNCQTSVTPHALSYCPELGLLAVVQRIGDRGLGSEVIVWDVRSQSCLWRERLPGAPADPAGVQLLPNGRLVVSGGNGKFHSSDYVHVYDLWQRKLLYEKRIRLIANPGFLRVTALPVGDQILASGKIVALDFDERGNDYSPNGLHIADPATGQEVVLAPEQVVTSSTLLPDGATALFGNDMGEIYRIGLRDGRTERIGSPRMGRITALVVSPNGKRWAAGDSDGNVVTAPLGAERTSGGAAELRGLAACRT